MDARRIIFGASAPGLRHRRDGDPCQDAHRWAVAPDGAVLLAVADGAGSAPRGGAGAQLAVDAAAEAVGDSADPAERLWCALRAARAALEQAAAGAGEPLHAYATTLLLVLWQQGKVAAAHVGDGAAVAWSPEGGWSLASAPGDSEYANETDFITGQEWEEQVRLTRLAEPVAFVALFTDGLQRAALLRRPGGWQPFPGFLEPIRQYVASAPSTGEATEALQQLLTSAKLDAHSDDDKTLLLLYEQPEP